MTQQAREQAKWTFMVYLAGDNNLSAAGDTDLAEMRTVGSTREVNVVAEFDNAGAHGTRRFHVQRDGREETVMELGETDCGAPEVLLNFIRWAREKYPAERYALILWNHGSGWEPSEVERIAARVNTRDFNLREAQERRSSPLGRVFFRTTLEKIYSLPTVSERAIASDDGTGHSLDTLELGNVLRQTEACLGQKLDLLGMDACLMANLEVAYQARPFVRYIVASVENEPNQGWPYDTVLGKLVTTPEVSTADLAGHIVSAYIEYYVNKGYTGVVSQTAVNLARVDALAEPLGALATAITAHFPEARREIGEALYGTPARFWRGTLWDIVNFCLVLATETESVAVKEAAHAVVSALRPGPDRFILDQQHRGAKLERSGGISVYLPPRILHAVSPYYEELAFFQEHPWSAMLNAYHTT